ncbi:MAG: hypothetical protein BV456_11175 [Thermoplasmata archaeon M8B2D]|nr:MAG: hypothetical protein BV456_11175 [Thermoplasmata archaeon M8B2D]
MRNIINNYGRTAGKIWKTLYEYGPLDEDNLIKKSRLNKNEFYTGVGWLARENKIFKNKNIYELRETNLTGKIGGAAGKVWNALYTTKNINVSSIAKISEITLKDAYSALGWLAREDKIKTKWENKHIKFELK